MLFILSMRLNLCIFLTDHSELYILLCVLLITISNFGEQTGLSNDDGAPRRMLSYWFRQIWVKFGEIILQSWFSSWTRYTFILIDCAIELCPDPFLSRIYRTYEPIGSAHAKVPLLVHTWKTRAYKLNSHLHIKNNHNTHRECHEGWIT